MGRVKSGSVTRSRVRNILRGCRSRKGSSLINRAAIAVNWVLKVLLVAKEQVVFGKQALMTLRKFHQRFVPAFRFLVVTIAEAILHLSGKSSSRTKTCWKSRISRGSCATHQYRGKSDLVSVLQDDDIFPAGATSSRDEKVENGRV